jgi:hypothetical protein
LGHPELQQYSHANGIPKESKTVEDKLLEYARIEHARKMQVLEEEHHLQMEILTIQRDRATRVHLHLFHFEILDW